MAPVTLSAAKATLGHTETAAGAIGIFRSAIGSCLICISTNSDATADLTAGDVSCTTMHSPPCRATMCLQHAAHPEMLHLRDLNPYVASSLAAAKANASKAAAAAGSGMTHAGGFSAARQAAAVPAYHLGDDAHGSGSTAAGAIGISAFAFQGTNAHMLVAATAGSSIAPEPQHLHPAVWQRRRYWYAPEPSALLVAASAAGGKNAYVAFTLQLRAPGLAYLHDHQVCSRATSDTTRQY